jgi:hypothetical protein
MIPAFDRAKTFHALDRAATVIVLKLHADQSINFVMFVSSLLPSKSEV